MASGVMGRKLGEPSRRRGLEEGCPQGGVPEGYPRGSLKEAWPKAAPSLRTGPQPDPPRL